MIRSDFFEEAIYFASPDLYEELQKYKAGKIKEKDYIRVENALFKYLARADVPRSGCFLPVQQGKREICQKSS